jgi:hypothetical protein
VIAFLLAAALTASPSPAPARSPVATALSPASIVAKYGAALKRLREPRVFTVEYTLVQTGTRTLEQTHRIFRSGADERDETLAVNGTRSTTPVVRIFRSRPYRYTVAALGPKPAAYTFTFAGPHRDGKHLDYVFDLTPKDNKPRAFAFTQVTIDGVTFLPSAIGFVTGAHGGRGSVTFGKSDRFWVARSAAAEANVPGGVARERLAFARWRFPPALPASTFSAPRRLMSPPPAPP